MKQLQDVSSTPCSSGVNPHLARFLLALCKKKNEGCIMPASKKASGRLRATTFWLTIVAAGTADAGFIADVQMVEFCDDAGDNCATLAQESLDVVNSIWSLADIQFNFLPAVQLNNSDFLQTDFATALDVLQSFDSLHDFSAQLLVGLIDSDGTAASGLGTVGPGTQGKGLSAIETGLLSADFQGIVLAHMIGHNLGLLHEELEETNLMFTSQVHDDSSQITLLSDQIETAQQSVLLRQAPTLSVNAPPPLVLVVIGLFVAFTARARSLCSPNQRASLAA